MAPAASQPVLDKKRTVILLRSVVTVAAGYLILFGRSTIGAGSALYVLVLVLSNIALGLAPREWFERARFSAALLLGDTAMVLIALALTVGCSQDFLLVYFFTIFLTTTATTIGEIALAATLTSGLYGYWLSLTASQPLGPGEWLRLPFFFTIAIFYAYVTEGAKRERLQRLQAEHENERLRFLLNLSSALSERTMSEALARQVDDLLKAVLPQRRCRLHLEPDRPGAGGVCFPVGACGHTFGTLHVVGNRGEGLLPEEEQFCRVVAAFTANTLYAAEQSESAQEGRRLKQEFLAVLSHELRSPLQSIIGNADILTEELDSAPPLLRESVDQLRASGLHLLNLVEQLLCFVELRARRGVVESETVSLPDLFEELRGAASEELGGRPIRFHSQVEAGAALIETDRRKLRLALGGLISNAIKFTHQGFVRLSARRLREDEVEIAVQDSGIGIEHADLGQIFEEFRQVDGSMTRRFGGLGMGLALAREVALALGGDIVVESTPNCGSTFRMQLPANRI